MDDIGWQFVQKGFGRTQPVGHAREIDIALLVLSLRREMDCFCTASPITIGIVEANTGTNRPRVPVNRKQGEDLIFGESRFDITMTIAPGLQFFELSIPPIRPVNRSGHRKGFVASNLESVDNPFRQFPTLRH